MKIVSSFLLAISISAVAIGQQKVIKQGHRGARGLMPENTIAAMKKGLDLGAQVLELDVVISKDKQVVVSHDAYFSSVISLKPSGDSVSVAEEKQLILYGMPYAEIKKYDVGSKHNVQFPEQQNFPDHKPLLSAMIDSVYLYAKQKGVALPYFNIEIKSDPKTDGVNQPVPQEFVDLVIAVCKSRNMFDRMNIQSFDARPLQLIHKQFPEVKLAYLTANAKTIAENIEFLGFKPDYYSPYYKTVTAEAVKFCHEKGMLIIPWTVNTKPEIDTLIGYGVDGIITDYPNLF